MAKKNISNTGFTLPTLQDAYFYPCGFTTFINVPHYNENDLLNILHHFCEYEDGNIKGNIVVSYYDKNRNFHSFVYKIDKDSKEFTATLLDLRLVSILLKWNNKNIWLDFSEKPYMDLSLDRETERFIHVHQ